MKPILGLRETPDEEIVNRIYIVRGEKVMLDGHLAEMYGGEINVLNRAVKRNLVRFPDDFMFQPSGEEWSVPRLQIETLEKGKYPKFPPYAFTEQDVAQLSSVLCSEQAIQVNIRIVRVYTKRRRLLTDSKDLRQRVENTERRMDKGDGKTDALFTALKSFLIKKEKPRNKIGFRLPAKKKKK